MTDDTIPLAKPVLTTEMQTAALDALANERLVMGESVHEFEAEFAEYVGADHAVSVSSGTSALHLALEALGIGPGDDVACPTLSFIATANAAVHAGATPMLCDAKPDTLGLDPSEISDPDAVIPVHLYGTPVEMEAIRKAAGDAPVVEDACQAHGAKYNGDDVGSLGKVGCFSFYTTKNLTVAGDGGMVTTDDGDLAETIASLRDCGRSSHDVHERIGYTSRLNTVNAAIGRVQLREMEAWNRRRRTVAKVYRSHLSGVGDVEIPEIPDGAEPVYHLFTIGTDHRDGLRSFLDDRGIETGIHYPAPIHLQPAYQERFGTGPGTHTVAESWTSRTLSLPVFPEMTIEQAERVAENIIAYFQEVAV